MSGQPCHLRPWCGPSLKLTEDHVWFHGYTVAGSHVDVWFMLPLENTGDVLVVAAIGDHMDVQKGCCSSWMWNSGELAPFLTSTQRAGPEPGSGSTVELAVVAGVSKLALRAGVWENMTPPLIWRGEAQQR